MSLYLRLSGKLFRCIDLPGLIQFFLMFFNDKPVDWLLDGFLQTKVCNLEKDAVSLHFCFRLLIHLLSTYLYLQFFSRIQKSCKYQKDRLWVHVKPSLFQHIGTTSSLKGKVQKLKVRSCFFFSCMTIVQLQQS